MSWITARRRHWAAGYAVILLGLVVIGVIYAAFTGQDTPALAATPASSPSSSGAVQTRQASHAQSSQISEGAHLFAVTCATCHGMDAQGTSLAPSLIGVGAAAVDFQVSTGRMPAKELGAEMPQKPRQLNTQETHAIAAYIASLGGGPAIPSAAEVSTKGADLGLGQQLFSTDCAQCHNYSGAGGALTDGKYAPPLTRATPTQIYEAMLTGPEAMPVFNNTTISPGQKRDIIAYVTTLRAEANPGGFSLGRIGPVTEGIVIFLGGIGVLVFIALWITMKRRES